ncbi:Na(+)/H(+) antiporter subunit C [Scrofimicrobium sp. R131]|uniref:Na(+)/H(+) antiporter subunit C n=1 Tax=Scrofimicrobium appendicitidis TaxID=3079930 RepID=A0AAU7V836_9ACTO
MPSLAMLLLAGALVGTGVYLALERTLTRVFIGLSFITNGVNVLILAMAGPAGLPPLLWGDWGQIADPLPQALILTSIVLSLGTTAFGLALAYRSWRLTGHDEVVDDIEDRRLARLAQRQRRRGEDYGVEGTEDPGVDYDRSSEGSDQ